MRENVINRLMTEYPAPLYYSEKLNETARNEYRNHLEDLSDDSLINLLVGAANEKGYAEGFDAARAVPAPFQSVQSIEVERWMQNVLGLIKQYGNECATEAYHGDLHCREAPRDVFAEIEKEIAAPR
jgi:hypothetical protein